MAEVSPLLALLENANERADRAEAERDQWKANHDNQVKLKQQLMDRPDLKERAKLVMDMAARTRRAKALLAEAVSLLRPYGLIYKDPHVIAFVQHYDADTSL